MSASTPGKPGVGAGRKPMGNKRKKK
jgi:hypothetical protein